VHAGFPWRRKKIEAFGTLAGRARPQTGENRHGDAENLYMSAPTGEPAARKAPNDRRPEDTTEDTTEDNPEHTTEDGRKEPGRIPGLLDAQRAASIQANTIIANATTTARPLDSSQRRIRRRARRE
jgi:hypothetical protein